MRRNRAAAALAAAALAGSGLAIGISEATATGATPASAVTATPVSDTGSSLTPQQIYEQDAKSVVEIRVTTAQTDPFGRTQTAEAEGSGFVYDTSGDIVTNDHVVDGATSITVTFADGTTARATVVATDPSADLAVIRVSVAAAKLQPLTLADSSDIAVGDAVAAIGSPFGLENSLTTGIVSARGRTITSPDNATITGVLQTDAAVNPGNSGGPLLNAQGEVIGVLAQIESSSNGNEGVAFAIPSNTVRTVVEKLIAGTL